MNISFATMRAHGSRMVRAAIPAAARLSRPARTTPGVLCLAGAASLLCGVFLHPRGLLMAAGLAGVTALGLAWPWLSVRGLSGSIHFDRRRGREGEATTVRLTVRNRLPWGVWGLSVKGDFGGPDIRLSLPFVKGRGIAEAAFEIRPPARGEYPPGVPRLATGFPFGLWEATRPLEVRDRLIVWPRTYPVAVPMEVASGASGEGLAPRDRAGGRGDLMGVRPYRRGEPLGRVHWGQTARHAELIVCENRSTAAPRVRIVLDHRPEVHTGNGPDSSREWAVRIAASLAERWVLMGADISLSWGRRTFVPPGNAQATRRVMLLDALARLESEPAIPSESAPAFEALRLSTVSRRTAETRIVITTDLGVRLPSRDISASPGDLRVVLMTAGFDPAADVAGPAATDIAAWIRIEAPGCVASRLRAAGRGNGHAS